VKECLQRQHIAVFWVDQRNPLAKRPFVGPLLIRRGLVGNVACDCCSIVGKPFLLVGNCHYAMLLCVIWLMGSATFFFFVILLFFTAGAVGGGSVTVNAWPGTLIFFLFFFVLPTAGGEVSMVGSGGGGGRMTSISLSAVAATRGPSWQQQDARSCSSGVGVSVGINGGDGKG
jgi:hypothetical protein